MDRNLSILIVHHDVNMARSVAEMLINSYSVDVYVTKVTERATEFLENQRVDMVMASSDLLGVSPFDWLHMIREEHPDAIRVLLTPENPTEKDQQGIASGLIQQCLAEPVNPADLAATLQGYFFDSDSISTKTAAVATSVPDERVEGDEGSLDVEAPEIAEGTDGEIPPRAEPDTEDESEILDLADVVESDMEPEVHEEEIVLDLKEPLEASSAAEPFPSADSERSLIDEARLEFEELSNEHQRLETENKALRNSVEGLKNSVEALREENDALGKTKKEILEQKVHLDKDIRTAGADVSRLTEQLEALATQRNDLTRQVAECEQEMVELTQKHTSLEQDLIKEREYSSIDWSFTDPQELREAIGPVEIYEKASKWAENWQRAEYRAELLQISVKSHDSELADLHEEVDRVRRHSTRREAELSRELEEYRQLCLGLEQRSERLEQRNKEMVEERAKLKEDLDRLKDIWRHFKESVSQD